MSASQVNYREQFFQTPHLTKIHGIPTYSCIAKLEREIKSNGIAVESTLGGGAHGLLGLVSSTAAYERIAPGTPFIRPQFPVLVYQPLATGPQISEAERIYNIELNQFQMCNLVERTIRQQINTAVPANCLAYMIDEETGFLGGTVPQIIQRLFDTYGAITPAALSVARNDVEKLKYDHTTPVQHIFSKITEYANMATRAKTTETTAHLINIGIIILTRSNVFQGDIRKWQEKPEADQTWPLFKEHFSAAQQAIWLSNSNITTDSLGYHEANTASIVNQVMDRMTTANSSPPDTASIANTTLTNTIMEQQMQLSLSAQQNQTMLETMNALAAQVANLQNQQPGNNGSRQERGRDRSNNNGGRGNGTNNSGRGNGRSNAGNGGSPPGYCWSHGNCKHTSAACNFKSDGHIDNATFTNMQGGSTARCHWL
jgi:hypothetical protein